MSRDDHDAIAHIRDLHGVADLELLGDIVLGPDRVQDYLQAADYYAWYYASARHLKPRRIGEIGVRLGYSLKAMLLGTVDGGVDPGEVVLHGFDNECYHPGSLAHCARHLEGTMDFHAFHSHLVDSQSLEDLGVGALDLVHVDGDHSEAGAAHDLALARAAVAPGGVILVDDIGDITKGEATAVTRAADRFCREHGLEPVFIPHFRGMYLIRLGDVRS